MRTAANAILLADTGGTNVRFALADVDAAHVLLDDSIRHYHVADFATFTDAAQAYLKETGERSQRGVFGFAGPVHDGQVHITNHPWSISGEQVRVALGLQYIHLLNDFAAMSLCLPLLREDDVHCIGTPPVPDMAAATTARYAVVGPGTGLGVGALLIEGGRVSALETEGGHCSFAPRTDEDIEILRRLSARFGRVSNERLLSGSGLANLHAALGDIHGTGADHLAPEEITRRAIADADAACIRSVERFCEILGAVAGDFVLAFGAWNGVYLGGGLPPLLIPWLEHGRFRRRFEDKGRFREALARLPSVIVMHPNAGLLGAAAYAIVASGALLLDQRRRRQSKT